MRTGQDDDVIRIIAWVQRHSPQVFPDLDQVSCIQNAMSYSGHAVEIRFGIFVPRGVWQLHTHEYDNDRELRVSLARLGLRGYRGPRIPFRLE